MGYRGFSWSLSIAGALLLGVALSEAGAASISFSDAIPLTDTDFNSPCRCRSSTPLSARSR